MSVALGRLGTHCLLCLKLVWRRLAARPGFAGVFLLSVGLTLGLVISIPVFAELASRQVLVEELEAAGDVSPYATPEHPLLLTLLCLERP